MNTWNDTEAEQRLNNGENLHDVLHHGFPYARIFLARGVPEDVLQDTWIKLLEKASEPENTFAYLAVVVNNQLIDYHRAEVRRHAREKRLP